MAWPLGDNDAPILLVVLLVLFLPAFLASLEVVRPGPWRLRGYTPNSAPAAPVDFAPGQHQALGVIAHDSGQLVPRPLREVALLFLRLGFTAFGGPAAGVGRWWLQ
jgi:hypothetical protein